MKHPFNFTAGDTPARLLADVLALLIVTALCWALWILTT